MKIKVAVKPVQVPVQVNSYTVELNLTEKEMYYFQHIFRLDLTIPELVVKDNPRNMTKNDQHNIECLMYKVHCSINQY